MPGSRQGDSPHWAKEIAAARKALGLSQGALARRFTPPVTAVAISNWERGLSEPGPERYLELGRMLGDPACWYFWQRAGLSKSDVSRVLPELENRLYARGRPAVEVLAARGATRHGDPLALKKKPDAVAIPLLKDSAAAGSPRLIEESEVEQTLLLPARMCPHPEETTCIRIDGDSMSPVLEQGYIVAIDTHPADRARLYNRMVAARDSGGGITVKWLRRIGQDELLVPQHTSTRYQPVILTKEPGWKIVGEVIWWIGWPPPPPRGEK